MDKRASKTTSSYRAPLFNPMVILCALVLCPFCAWRGVLTARNSFLLADRLRAENDRLEREVLAFRLRNQRAEIAIAELKTREGIEREARKIGWVYPTEHRLRLPAR